MTRSRILFVVLVAVLATACPGVDGQDGGTGGAAGGLASGGGSGGGVGGGGGLASGGGSGGGVGGGLASGGGSGGGVGGGLPSGGGSGGGVGGVGGGLPSGGGSGGGVGGGLANGGGSGGFGGGAPIYFSAGTVVGVASVRDGGPAYRCDGGTLCIDMRRYWPTPDAGTTFVKDWAFFPGDGGFAETANFRRQSYFQMSGAPSNEFVLVDYFAHPGQPAIWEEWIDTWHVRYDGNTVIEFKDDANFQQAFNKGPGVVFGRTSYESGFELRWGNVLQLGVVNLSPTHSYSSLFAVDAGSLLPVQVLADAGYGPTSPTAQLEGRSDNFFMFYELRDNVIVKGRRYDQVAVVRVDQRACTTATLGACGYDPQHTAAYNINYFYMAPGLGHLVNFGYEAAKLPDGGWDFANGQFAIEYKYGEVAKAMCSQPVRTPTPQFDWQVATNDLVTAGSAAPPPCP